MEKILSKEVSTAMYVDKASNDTYEVVFHFKGVTKEQLETLKVLGMNICNASVTEFTTLAPTVFASTAPETEKMQQVCASKEDEGKVTDDIYGLYKMSRSEAIDWFVANFKNVAFINNGEVNLIRAYRIAMGNTKDNIEAAKEKYTELFEKNKSVLEEFYEKHHKMENAFD